jgi:hypothetical protein
VDRSRVRLAFLGAREERALAAEVTAFAASMTAPAATADGFDLIAECERAVAREGS